MSYSTIATMSRSASLLDRASAATATEIVAAGSESAYQAGAWASQHAWDFAATPGWAAKWESAVAGGITDPGADPAVITDADLLARVQPLLAAFPIPTP